MASNRIRVYRGANELNIRGGVVSKSDDQVVDKVHMEIEYDSNIDIGTVLTFKQSDGSTTFFSGQVSEIDRQNICKILVLTNGAELNRLFIQTNYTNRSPEYIVQDIIDNYTQNLTYASSTSSGITLDKYLAKDYAITILSEMMQLLDWSLRIDESDNVYFEPRGDTYSGFTFNTSTNCNIKSYKSDKTGLVNRAVVTGGFKSFLTEETVSGTGTEFTLSYKPNANVQAVVSGSEIDADDYTVDAPNKKITFNSSRTNPTFTYSYDKPIIVTASNDASINTYSMEITKNYQAPFLNNVADVRAYAKSLVNLYGEPQISAKVELAGYDFGFDVGESARFVDVVRSIDTILVISKIQYDIQGGKTIVQLGTREYILIDWQQEVKERIRKLERRYSDEDKTILSKVTNNNLDVELTLSETAEYANPRNNFYLNHPTLSYPRTGYNDEPDCSGNGNNGTWSSDDGGGIIDTADATGTWSATHAGHSISLNSDEWLEGSGSLNCVKNGTQSEFEATNTISATDMSGTDMWLRQWVYIKDAATLGKIAQIRYTLTDSAADYEFWLFPSLSIGWNRLDCELNSPDSGVNSLDYTDITELKIEIITNNTTDEFAAGDVLIDVTHYGNVNGGQFNYNYGQYDSSTTAGEEFRICNGLFYNNAIVTVSDSSDIRGINVCAWYFMVKSDNVSGIVPILSKWTGTNSTSHYKISIVNEEFRLDISDGTNNEHFTSSYGGISANTLYKVAILFNAGVVSIYINGANPDIIVGSTVSSMNNASGTDLIIGMDEDSNYFKGELDEIIIENKDITQSDVWNYNLKKYDTTDQRLWLSFDNALLGSRISPRWSF